MKNLFILSTVLVSTLFLSTCPYESQEERFNQENYNNKNRLEGDWNTLKWDIKDHWGYLTDDDLRQIDGRKDRLSQALQKRYNYTKEQAQQQINNWERKYYPNHYDRDLDNIYETKLLNADTFDGNWSFLKGKIRENWGRLTDDDIRQIDERKDRLLEAIQKRYGYTKDHAEQQMDDFEKKYSLGLYHKDLDHQYSEDQLNSNDLHGNWDVSKKKIKENWEELTDDDIRQISGKKDKLVEALQKRYGYSKQQAQKEVYQWERKYHHEYHMNLLNSDTLDGNWSILKGQIKENWGRLTDSDITVIDGKREQLLGALQKRYGYNKEEAIAELNAWEKKHNKKTDKKRHDQSAAKVSNSEKNSH